jgi:RNA polymerase sigma factor (sigma-70 family)
MTSETDSAWLRQFAEQRSETAFAALVDRHLNLVYSVALRKVGNPHQAQEITQAVFIILARKAPQLRHEQALSSWLFQTTRLTANNFLRGEMRRRQREQEACMQSTLNEPDDCWPHIAPLLDAAVETLGETDRRAIVLRFYEGRNLREVGAAMGASEAAAEKRVSRALDKLRKFFGRRGITLSISTLAATVAAHSIQAAPVGLAAVVTTTVHSAALSAPTLHLVNGALKIMFWTKAKTALAVAAGLILTTGTVTIAVSVLNGGNREARGLLQQVTQKYASLASYESTGTTSEEINGKTLTCSFTLQLGRTNLYLLHYEQHAPTYTNRGTIWNDGSGDYFANEMEPHTNRIRWPAATGLTGSFEAIAAGSANAGAIVPELFYGIPIPYTDWGDSAWHPVLANSTNAVDSTRLLRKVTDEKVGDTDCYVLAIPSHSGENRLWIGKHDLLVHQSQQIYHFKPEATTDAEIDGFLAVSQGKLALTHAELKAKVIAARQKAFDTMKPVTLVLSANPAIPGINSVTFNPPGSNAVVTTQIHDHIAINRPYSPADFAR